MNTNHVTSVMIRSVDPMRLAAWYSEILEVQFDERLPEGCFGALSGVQFGILQSKISSKHSDSPIALSYAVPEFDVTIRKLDRCHVRYTIEQINPTRRVAYLRDPDLNQLAIIEYGTE